MFCARVFKFALYVMNIGVSQELKDFIRWMMEPDPIKRPLAADILQEPFIKKVSLIKTWI